MWAFHINAFSSHLTATLTGDVALQCRRRRKYCELKTDKITGYALDKAMKEWSATKNMADNIEEDKLELQFEPGTECKLGCELPLRYGLPCKHWLYKAFIDDVAIPLSLFHPRWLLDGPAMLHERWFISWDLSLVLQPNTSLRHAGDRFQRRGEDLIQEAALAAIEKLRSLPAGQAEAFAATFIKDVDKLNVAQDKLTESRQLLPATLPEPLVEPKLRAFPTSRKRAMTGREAAEQQERDQARARRRAQQQHDENEMWAVQMRLETQLRYSQRDGQSQSQSTTQLVPETQLSALSQLSKTPSVELSFDEDNSRSSPTESSTENKNDHPNQEPRRSGRVKRPSRDKASQLSQEEAEARLKASKKGKGRKMRKSIPTSQLLEEFAIDLE
jgi:hypothetical protein